MAAPTRSSAAKIFVELKRRKVFQVAATYAVVAWIVIQVSNTVFPALEMPAWTLRLVVLLALFGFPIALVLAWAFELTMDGPRKEADEPHGEDENPRPSAVATAALRRSLFVALGAVVVASLIGSVYLLRRPVAGVAAPGERSAIAGMRTLTQLTFSSGVEEYPAFSPEGNRLAFSREVGGYKQIFVRSLETGQEIQLTEELLDHIQPAWSPDGSGLLYVRTRDAEVKLAPNDVFGPFVGGDVWRVDLATRHRKLLFEDAYNPSYSPDGARIAFDASRGGPRRIWTTDALGHNPEQMTTDESEAVSHIAPAWSPDGRKIAFQNVEKTKHDIRVVDLASRAVTWVTDDLVPDLDPVWSHSGDEILFSSPRGGGLNLWRASPGPDGAPAAPPQQITTGAGQDVHVAVSPDGGRLAFAILNQNADLWRLPVSPETGEASGPPEPLIATTREESRASWAPDGRHVAFNSDRGGEMNLWIHSLADGTAYQLTSGPGGDYQPQWSPDGRQIVFFSSRAGNADIWRIDVETGHLQQLTTAPTLDVNPFFSPDGTRIAYQSDHGGRKELWVMNADGSNPRQLTTDGVDDHFLLWTADSRSIVAKIRGTIRQIYLDGSRSRDLPTVRGGAHMSFSPARSLIMDVEGHRTLWASPIDGGEPRRVFEFEDPDVRIDYPFWTTDGRWILFDRHKPTGADIWILNPQGGSRPDA